MVKEMGFLDLERDSDNATVIGKDDTTTEHIELSIPSSDSIITIPITTFHLFSTFPHGLQMLIWFHAIGDFHLDMNFLRHLSNSRSGRDLRLSRPELITQATRITLMATCRLTRMLALQAMRKDTARIWISLAFREHKVEHLQFSQWSVLKVVDGCIGEVKARMGDKPFKRGWALLFGKEGRVSTTPPYFYRIEDNLLVCLQRNLSLFDHGSSGRAHRQYNLTT